MDANGLEAKERVSASKKLSASDARALAKEASTLHIAKGKKLTSFTPRGKPTKDMIDAMLGPTGNLRAPTIRSGKTLIVGFNEELFEKHFG